MQPMQRYAMLCRNFMPMQPIQCYAMLCRNFMQPMQCYAMLCRNFMPMQPMRRRWGDSNRWERTKGVLDAGWCWMVLDKEKKLRAEGPGWAGEQFNPYKGGCPTCVGPKALRAVPLAWAPRPPVTTGGAVQGRLESGRIFPQRYGSGGHDGRTHRLICPGLEPGISGSGGRRLIH